MPHLHSLQTATSADIQSNGTDQLKHSQYTDELWITSAVLIYPFYTRSCAACSRVQTGGWISARSLTIQVVSRPLHLGLPAVSFDLYNAMISSSQCNVNVDLYNAYSHSVSDALNAWGTVWRDMSWECVRRCQCSDRNCKDHCRTISMSSAQPQWRHDDHTCPSGTLGWRVGGGWRNEDAVV